LFDNVQFPIFTAEKLRKNAKAIHRTERFESLAEAREKLAQYLGFSDWHHALKTVEGGTAIASPGKYTTKNEISLSRYISSLDCVNSKGILAFTHEKRYFPDQVPIEIGGLKAMAQEYSFDSGFVQTEANSFYDCFDKMLPVFVSDDFNISAPTSFPGTINPEEEGDEEDEVDEVDEEFEFTIDDEEELNILDYFPCIFVARYDSNIPLMVFDSVDDKGFKRKISVHALMLAGPRYVYATFDGSLNEDVVIEVSELDEDFLLALYKKILDSKIAIAMCSLPIQVVSERWNYTHVVKKALFVTSEKGQIPFPFNESAGQKLKKRMLKEISEGLEWED